MTLPVIQPVDGPDWSTIPSFTTQTFNFPAVAMSGEVLLEQQLGYYAYAVLVISGDGDGADYAVEIEILDAPSTEGGSVIFSQTTQRVFNVATIVPMSVLGQSIRLRDAGATTYPHNIIGSLTLYSAYPFQTGFPGGVGVINATATVTAGNAQAFLPAGCAPGQHQVFISTVAAAWRLEYVVATVPGSSVTVILADQTTPQPFNVSFIAPASAWSLNWDNDDILDHDVGIVCNRLP